MMADLPFPSSSTSATALNLMEPLPFRIASLIVGVSTTKPPVGKSGAFIIFKYSEGFGFLVFSVNLTASVISLKL